MPEGSVASIKYLIAITLMHNFVKSHDFQNRHLQNNVPFSSETSHENGKYPLSSKHLFNSWSQWSSCSTSCGQGVSKRTRTCNTKQLNSRGEPFCHGDSSEYSVCKIKDCPPGVPDFRAYQCAQYNGKLVAGQRTNSWTPSNGGVNSCELRCQTGPEQLIYVFGKAADGTSCPEGVCLDGRCLKIGCDDRIGSGAETDMCGLCSGRNATCVHYKDVFYGQPISSSSGKKTSRYETVVILPIGTRNFKLRKNVDDNILGVKDRTDSILFHKSDSLPQEKRLAGTTVQYRTESNANSLFILGPTLTELHVMVLLRVKDEGIHYQYWVPLDKQHWETSFKSVKLAHDLTGDLTSSQADQSSVYTKEDGPLWKSTSKSSLTYFPAQKFSPVTKSDLKLIPKGETRYSKSYTTSSSLQYGPKRPGFNLWDNSSLAIGNIRYSPKSDPYYSSNRTKLQRKDALQYRLNYKTPKPIYNYYEKYRNISLSGKDEFHRKSIFLHQHTQRDSSDSLNTKNIALPKDVDKKLRLKTEKNKKLNKGFSSRWEYHLNGKEFDTSTEDLLQTPVSISVLSLPDAFNETKFGDIDSSRNRSTRGGLCGPCHKVRDLTRHFCTSDFVVRVIVLNYEVHLGETRYELDIQQSYKNVLALLPREYIWSPDTCKCPKLRIGKEYILMGKIDTNYRRNESRLLIDKSSFVRTYNLKRERRLNKLKTSYSRKCSKIS